MRLLKKIARKDHALKENKKMIIGFNAFSTAEDQIQFNNEMKPPYIFKI